MEQAILFSFAERESLWLLPHRFNLKKNNNKKNKMETYTCYYVRGVSKKSPEPVVGDSVPHVESRLLQTLYNRCVTHRKETLLKQQLWDWEAEHSRERCSVTDQLLHKTLQYRDDTSQLSMQPDTCTQKHVLTPSPLPQTNTVSIGLIDKCFLWKVGAGVFNWDVLFL